jgi:hypothetical protein
MKEPATKVSVRIGTDQPIHVGPFFTRKLFVIQPRLPGLLRSGYFREASIHSPELVSQMIDAAEITVSEYNIHEAYCFFS